MAFPTTRLRRLRQSAALRNLVRETRLTPESLVYPLFVCPGKGVRRPVSSMPGVAGPRVVVAKSSKAAVAAAAEAMTQEFEIANDETLEILAKTAVSLARAGVDIVAPSDMMDGRVAAIRQALDAAGSSNAP